MMDTLEEVFESWLQHGFISIVRSDIRTLSVSQIGASEWSDHTGILSIISGQVFFKYSV